jgi:hypothetical protein
MSKNRLTVSYGEFKEGFVRFWKELAFIEGGTRLPGSPIDSALSKMEEETMNGCDQQFQVIFYVLMIHFK